MVFEFLFNGISIEFFINSYKQHDNLQQANISYIKKSVVWSYPIIFKYTANRIITNFIAARDAT